MEEPKKKDSGSKVVMIVSLIILIIIFILIYYSGNKKQGNKKQGNKYYVTYYSSNLVNGDHEVDIDSIFETSDSAALMSALIMHNIRLGQYYESVNTTELYSVFSRPDSFVLINPNKQNITNKDFVGRDSVVKSMYREHVSLNKSIYDEKERYANKAKLERDSIVKNSIVITSAYLSSPNSAGGCDAYFYYKNLSDKTIKYLWWTGIVFNTVGDAVGCEIRDIYDFGGKDTGPVKKGGKGGGCWDCVIYNNSAELLQITDIQIEYMDGSTLKLKGSDINLIRKK